MTDGRAIRFVAATLDRDVGPGDDEAVELGAVGGDLADGQASGVTSTTVSEWTFETNRAVNGCQEAGSSFCSVL